MQPNQWQQQSQFGYSGGAPQGFQGGNPQFGHLGSQPTGYGLGAQPTGFAPSPRPPQPTGGNLGFLNAPPGGQFGGARGGLNQGFTGGGPGLSAQMTGFPAGGASGLLGQPTGFQGGGGLMPQATGYPGGGLVAQPTGFHDPRLQSMMQSFMPSNLSQPFASSGAPQFAQPPQQQPLTQQFQSLIQNPKVKTPRVPWTLSRQEKKDYDQIFRVWDTDGDGFITGETAREVFGQSGLKQDDLIKIWNLSDVDNRGKLNLPEFHVAMGLIYRALNGNEIPEKLPEELVPASMRDIDTTVTFMRDLLKHEASTRSNNASPSYGDRPDSRISAAASKDAMNFKHSDSGSGVYKPSSRHLDRKSVRYAGEEPDADIKDIRRQLANTSAMLDKNADDYTRKSAEDEELEQEMDDLRYKVKRLQEDIEYVSKGRRSADKDEERRKLEREMLYLMHEKLPELERRQKQREDDKRMEERAGVRARDRRNETSGRYDRYDDDRNGRDDRDWLKGTYDRDRERDRDRDRDYRRDDRDRDRSRDRYRDSSRDRRDRDRYDRPRSPPRSPPPAPPAAPTSSIAAPPPAPTPPATKAAAAPNTKNMTPEERKAYIQEQAQKRIRDRLNALGVSSGEEATPAVDTSTQERLDREKKEAEEKAKIADQEREAKEAARRKNLTGDAPTTPTLPDTATAPAAPKPPAPASPAGPLKSAMKKPAAPPPAPPPSRGAPAARGPPAPPPSRAAPAEDPEEKELREREEARQKAIADRRARLAALEQEEKEEEEREKAMLAARQSKAAGATSPAPPAAPAPPPAPAAPPAASGGGYNPFRKPSAGAAASPAAPAQPSGGSFNPFFKPPAAAAAASSPSVTSPPAAPEAPAPPPAPPAPKAPTTARSAPAEDEWETIKEQEHDSDSDSSDDDYASSRAKRGALASALFGGVASPSTSRPPSAPPAPKAPPAALANLGGGAPSGGGMSALLASIQAGKGLKKATTVEKSGVAGGKVIGDADPPAHITANITPPPPSPPAQASPSPAREREVDAFGGPLAGAAPSADEAKGEEDQWNINPNRQSVDWYAGLAADESHPAATFGENLQLESTREEDEEPSGHSGENGAAHGGDELDEFDMTKEIRVRSLYAYEGQRDVDLSFKENVVLVAHPAKDSSSPWWYGTLVESGAKGWFPHNYVEELKPVKAKALFTYEGGSDEQLPFVEGDVLTIVDSSEADWWKTEKAGVIFIVPASYLELVDGSITVPAPPPAPSAPPIAVAAPVDATPRSPAPQPPISFSARSPSPRISSPLASPRIDTSASPRVTSALLSPPAPPPPRPRSATLNSSTSYDSDSSDDSVLSWWSSSGSDSDTDPEVDEEKEAERKRREVERQRIMAQAGLKLRREPPGIPAAQSRKESRRKAPAKPRRHAPAPPVPAFASPSADIDAATPSISISDEKGPTPASTPPPDQPPEQQLQDAYARYEAFLAASQKRPDRTRTNSGAKPSASSGGLTPQATGAGTSPTSPSSSTLHLPSTAARLGAHTHTSHEAGSGGRLSGLWSRITAAPSPTPDRKSLISGPVGPITKIDTANISRNTDTPSPAPPPALSPGGPGADGRNGAGTPAPEGNADFGKTWSSLVDPSLLETMDSRERKRQEAIFEFIATEGAYNRDLQLMVEVFYAALMPILDDKALTVLFANLEDLLIFNMGFYSALEERQRSCRLYIDVIGDVLAQYAPNMAVYRPYCVNQTQAVRLLETLRKGNPQLAAVLQSIRESNEAVRGLDLSSYLLIPMQRITRYPLLLRQILHYSTPEQDLTQLQSALMTIESVVASINESVREADSYDRLRILSEDLWIGGEGRLDLTAPTAHQGPRRLLKEGAVAKAKSGKKLTMVLCNDILVLVQGRNLYRMPIPLFDVSVREAPRDETAFALKVDYQKGGDTIGLKAPSARDAKDWIGMIEKARMATIDSRKSVNRRSRAESLRSDF